MINKDFVGFGSSDHISTRRNRSKGNIYFMLILLGVTALVILLLKSMFSHSGTKNKILSSTLTPTTSITSIPTPQKNPSSQAISDIIEKSLEGTKGHYGIAIENLNTKESYFKNEDEVFKSASLYKLWVMAVVYRKIQDKSLNLNQTISADIKTLNKEFYINNALAEKKSGKITMSVKNALNLMITKSDNYAALLLSSKIKLFSLSEFLKQYGFNSSKIGINGKAPLTSAFDIYLFYKYLNENKFANSDNTKVMIGLLKGQVLNEKIPRDFPVNAVVAHKTGELELSSHDAGIVYAPNSTYIIVVLSKSETPDLANNRIANLSKDIYDYFERMNE